MARDQAVYEVEAFRNKMEEVRQLEVSNVPFCFAGRASPPTYAVMLTDSSFLPSRSFCISNL